MIIRILEKYELRPMDAHNWQLWRLAKDKDGNPKWQPMGRYYQSLSQVLKSVYERELRVAEGTYDLPRAIKQAQAVERRLLAAVEKEVLK
ncbi:hypothetical protein [Adlercreutzia sp. ZJ242]|uniref:hypothetical protein n=1 Tax=Adlercreutzia sp. ZJ242 TaxID=2709409 RepID=UPI0013EAC928|nr:hypothetical protein [Adlercreutzia sp. ZJ242]